MNVMLLAAGEGQRLRPFTEVQPKPLIPFLTVPLLYYSLALLENLPLSRVILNTHHLGHLLKEHFKKNPLKKGKVYFSEEKFELLGSGGGIHQAHELITGSWLDFFGDDDFLVMNADELILPHHPGMIKDLVAFHKWNKCLATLAVMPHPEVGQKFGGVWVGPDQNVNQFNKKDPQIDGVQGFHFVGVMVFSKRIFSFFKKPVQPENILYETLTTALQQKEIVKAFPIQAEWFETGNPDDFTKATRFLLQSVPAESEIYWHQFLMQTVRQFGGREPLVEKSDESLLKDLSQRLASWRVSFSI